jgi:uncharacterized protein
MQFSQEIDSHHYIIRSYTRGAVVISEPADSATILSWPDGEKRDGPTILQRTLSNSAVISPRHLVLDWPVQRLSAMTSDDLKPILALAPEIVLFGGGARLVWPPASIIGELQEQRIGVEVMDTAAACRTYNILMLEGRRVAAALLMIE